MRKTLTMPAALIALAVTEKQTSPVGGGWFAALGRFLRDETGIKSLQVLSAGPKAARIIGETANFNTVYFQITAARKFTKTEKALIFEKVAAFIEVRLIHTEKWESKHTVMGRASEQHDTKRVKVGDRRVSMKRYGITKFTMFIG